MRIIRDTDHDQIGFLCGAAVIRTMQVSAAHIAVDLVSFLLRPLCITRPDDHAVAAACPTLCQPGTFFTCTTDHGDSYQYLGILIAQGQSPLLGIIQWV